jgi:hypothetical protein
LISAGTPGAATRSSSPQEALALFQARLEAAFGTVASANYSTGSTQWTALRRTSRAGCFHQCPANINRGIVGNASAAAVRKQPAVWSS